MTNQTWIVDTNFVYNGLQETMGQYNIALISTVKQELDKHKTSSDSALSYQSRVANRFIFENYDSFIHITEEYDSEKILGVSYSNEVKDNKIVACAVANGYGILTNDLNMFSTAKDFNVPVESYREKTSRTNYTGIRKVIVEKGSKDEVLLAQAYEGTAINYYDLLPNEYLLFYDTQGMVIGKFRYDGEAIIPLKLPPYKVVKAKNPEQECALDLLHNDDIPIKFIIGTSGSGKTMISLKMGVHKVLDTGAHAKILMVRNPIGSGEDIGYLPGDFEDKTDKFFEPITSQFKHGYLEAQTLIETGQLEKHIPYFSKGLTWNDSYVLVDEAEDLTYTNVKLLGTRLGQQSAIVFSGDYQQTENKYKRDNGLIRMIDELKGNPLVGVVQLEEAVRSEASKLFADL